MPECSLRKRLPILRKLRAFLALSGESRRLAFDCLRVSLAVAVAFRLAGVGRTQRFLRAWAVPGRAAPAESAAESIARVRRAQLLVLRNAGFQGSCLVRSLTMWALLMRMGVSVELRIGFRRIAGKLEGHAWLEHDGEPVNDTRSLVDTYDVYDRPVSFDVWRAL